MKDSLEWQGTMLITAYAYYDLLNTKQMMVGGDGNHWVRQSFDMLGLPTEFVLDRYHRYREARRAFGFTSQKENWIRQICEEKPGDCDARDASRTITSTSEGSAKNAKVCEILDQ